MEKELSIIIASIALILLIIAIVVNIVMAIQIRRNRRRADDDEYPSQLSTIMKSPANKTYYSVQLKDASVMSEPSILNVTSSSPKNKTRSMNCTSDPILNLIADTPLKASLLRASSLDDIIHSSILTPPLTPFGSRRDIRFNPTDSTLSSMLFYTTPTCLSTFSKDDLTPQMRGGRSSSISSIVDELSLESPTFSPIFKPTSCSSKPVFMFNNLDTLV